MEPYVNAILLGLLNGVLACGVAVANNYLKQHNMRQISQDNLARFTAAADTRAGAWVAKEEPGWEKKIVPTNDPWIVKEAWTIMGALGDEANQLGMTPTKLQNMIAGGIGKLQTQAIAGTYMAAPAFVKASDMAVKA